MLAAEHDRDIRLWFHPQRLHLDETVVLHEAQTGQVLASFARITRRALADVVRTGWVRLETHAVLAFVVLARRGLWVHHRDHRSALAEFPSKIVGTATSVIIYSVHAGSAVLAHVILAIVDILRAVLTTISGRTFASVVRIMIHAFGAILARIKCSPTKVDLLRTDGARESWLTLALVRLHTVDAGRIVLAAVVHTIVDVDLTTGARISRKTLTTESTLLEYSARGIVATWIAVASVDHELAAFSVVSGRTETLELFLGHSHALCVVLAGEGEAGVALGQDVVANWAATHKAAGWCG